MGTEPPATVRVVKKLAKKAKRAPTPDVAAMEYIKA